MKFRSTYTRALAITTAIGALSFGAVACGGGETGTDTGAETTTTGGMETEGGMMETEGGMMTEGTTTG